MANESLTDKMKWLQQRAAEAQLRQDQKAAEMPHQLFLPGFDIGAMPNHLNRSSFIAPIARGCRKFHQQTVMVSRSDCVLEYTGEQYDEADGDLMMALIFYATNQPLGTPVKPNRAELLRKMGRSTGKTQYSWLHRRMRALTVGTLYIEAKKPDGSSRYRIGRSTAFHILSSFEYDDEAQAYTYTLDPRWVVLFSNREYALIDWDKRLQIDRGQDMAKALAACGYIRRPGAVVRAGLAQGQDAVRWADAGLQRLAGGGHRRACAAGDHRQGAH